MFRTLVILASTALLGSIPALAWNRTGHMVTGAIAYDELYRTDPAAAARVLAILRRHPQFESRWRPQLAGLNEPDQDRLLFMLAARWPDDIRGDAAFDHPVWHYVDYPYKPPGQPDSVHVLPPAPENLVEAFHRNIAVIQSAAPDEQKAVALCWIFHLLGDSHQPLHAAMLFTTQFPEGDRGGNLFYIRPDASNPMTQNLHAYWDNILLTDEHYQAAQARATALEQAMPRSSLRQLAESKFENWVHRESFDLAVSTTYRKGKLPASTDRNHGAALPRNYHAAAERAAEKRVALAGYRLAEVLKTTLP